MFIRLSAASQARSVALVAEYLELTEAVEIRQQVTYRVYWLDVQVAFTTTDGCVRIAGFIARTSPGLITIHGNSVFVHSITGTVDRRLREKAIKCAFADQVGKLSVTLSIRRYRSHFSGHHAAEAVVLPQSVFRQSPKRRVRSGRASPDDDVIVRLSLRVTIAHAPR